MEPRCDVARQTSCHIHSREGKEETRGGGRKGRERGRRKGRKGKEGRGKKGERMERKGEEGWEEREWNGMARRRGWI